MNNDNQNTKHQIDSMKALCLDGADGPVYKLGADRVAKFEWARDWTDWFFKVSPLGEKVENEYQVCKALYDGGVSVPKPYGVLRIEAPTNKDWGILGFPRKFPAFVMEYIGGCNPHPKYLKPQEQKKIDELVSKEREKVKKLGVKVSDADGWENTLWVPEEQKIYLIDFSRWSLT